MLEIITIGLIYFVRNFYIRKYFFDFNKQYQIYTARFWGDEILGMLKLWISNLGRLQSPDLAAAERVKLIKLPS